MRGAATEGIRTRLSEGWKIVAVLDVFLTASLENDPALLANWNIVKRVQMLAVSPAASPPINPAIQSTIASDDMLSLAAA